MAGVAKNVIQPYDKVIKGLKVAKRSRLRVVSAPGLALDITPSGHKSWLYIYRPTGGTPQVCKIGEYPAISIAAAIAAAGELRKRVKKGEDPAGLKRQKRDGVTGNTLQDWFERWRADQERRGAKSIKDRAGLFTRNVLRHTDLPGLDIADITRRQVIDALDDIAEETTPIQSDRTQSVLSGIFNFALDKDRLTANPCVRIKPRADEEPRSRVLSDEEIRYVWAAEGQENVDRLALRLILLTGTRRSEAAEMMRGEVNLARCYWMLPKERVKNGVQHVLPLTETALCVVKAAMLGHNHASVFATAEGPLTGGRLTRIVAAMRGEADYTPHDLRRTVGSRLSQLKVPKETREAILNHVTDKNASMTSAVYDWHDDFDEKREALEKWQAELQRIIAASD
jgi:integrase